MSGRVPAGVGPLVTETRVRKWRLDWPVSGGTRVARACLKAMPEDFQVNEVLDGFPEELSDQSSVAFVDGDGEHLCLRLEKTGDNTEYVAGELASLADCRPFDVGFCGLKDRHAVTTQWFSLYRPGMFEDDAALIAQVSECWRVKAVCRSTRKLRRGEHQWNHFTIRLRQVSASRDAVDAALESLKSHGAPNYFGPQRFGFGGANLDRAVHIDPSTLNRRRRHGRGRGRASGGRDSRKNVLYFSAARSWLFNEVLADRVVQGSWQMPLPGEPEAYATGPLWGDGGTSASGDVGQQERNIVACTPELAALFQTTRMKPERRPLVAMLKDLNWLWLEGDVLELDFFLEPGQYATTVLSDIFELEDMSLSHHTQSHG